MSTPDDPAGQGGGKADGSGVDFVDDTQNTDVGYAIDRNEDVSACELYVDSFGELSKSSYYHAGYTALLIDLVAPADQQVLSAGMSIVMDERVTRPSGAIDETLARTSVFHFGTREGSLFRGLLKLSFDSTDGTEGRRTPHRFAFFVDLEQADGSVQRTWQKSAPTADFTPADYSPQNYNYSDSMPINRSDGTAQISYLWRDSGSPIFAARERCRPR